MFKRVKGFLKIPPFQDAHVHFMIEGQRSTLVDCQAISDQFLSGGIAAVADMGHKSGCGLKFREVVDRKSSDPLKIHSAGFALYKKGTYGGFLGKGVSGKKEIKSTIHTLVKANVDFLKVINSGIVSLREEKPVTEGGFSLDEWKVIQEEAGVHGLPICCHANTYRAIRQAVDFGVSSVEHGFFISEETLHSMVEKNVAWTPTAFALLSIESSLAEKGKKHLENIMDHHLETIHYAASIGVKLQVGTDSGSKGVRSGESFFKELQLFKKSGLTLEQILSAACLDREEILKGNYLLVKKDFIEQGKIEALFIEGKKIEAPRTKVRGIFHAR
ncbi:MAG: hypothetical protein A2Y79_05980 [Deltaproteobacteria bacterium RBG_13_43_22]|nr:MAG: hypothetical protein A2Y79_05980 [Deltaproteobacteria bacterium RBG_13_43_22]